MEQRTAKELEEFWGDRFGSEWAERNNVDSPGRAAFWSDIVDELGIHSALEVGCGHGANLRYLSQRLDARRLWGVDINETALRMAVDSVPGAGFGWSTARRLPFRDAEFDLTFTVGVLIHQPDETLPLVLSEIVRTSRRHILFGEYHSAESETVEYRGEKGVLFKRDYARIVTDLFPELELIRSWEANAEYGFDRTTIDIFRRTGA